MVIEKHDRIMTVLLAVKLGTLTLKCLQASTDILIILKKAHIPLNFEKTDGSIGDFNFLSFNNVYLL